MMIRTCRGFLSESFRVMPRPKAVRLRSPRWDVSIAAVLLVGSIFGTGAALADDMRGRSDSGGIRGGTEGGRIHGGRRGGMMDRGCAVE